MCFLKAFSLKYYLYIKLGGLIVVTIIIVYIIIFLLYNISVNVLNLILRIVMSAIVHSAPVSGGRFQIQLANGEQVDMLVSRKNIDGTIPRHGLIGNIRFCKPGTNDEISIGARKPTEIQDIANQAIGKIKAQTETQSATFEKNRRIKAVAAVLLFLVAIAAVAAFLYFLMPAVAVLSTLSVFGMMSMTFAGSMLLSSIIASGYVLLKSRQRDMCMIKFLSKIPADLQNQIIFSISKAQFAQAS